MLQEVIALVYTANGVLVSLVYLPQLHTVWNDRTGAQSGSLLTWSLFSLSSMVALLYGVLVRIQGEGGMLSGRDRRFDVGCLLVLVLLPLSHAGSHDAQPVEHVLPLHLKAFEASFEVLNTLLEGCGFLTATKDQGGGASGAASGGPENSKSLVKSQVLY